MSDYKKFIHHYTWDSFDFLLLWEKQNLYGNDPPWWYCILKLCWLITLYVTVYICIWMYVCCMKTHWLTDTDFDHLLHDVMHHDQADNDPITILSVSHQWFHTTWVYIWVRTTEQYALMIMRSCIWWDMKNKHTWCNIAH